MRNLLLCLVLACTASVWAMSDDSSEAKGKSDTKSITKDMAHDAGMKKENTEHGHLKVTDVKMVSDSCSK